MTLDLPAMKELVAKATEGPWYAHETAPEFVSQVGTHMAICRVNTPVVNDYSRGITVSGPKSMREDNKRFIAESRTFIPAAIARIEELEAEVADLACRLEATDD